MRKLFVSSFALMFISSVLAEQAREKVESEKNEPVVSDTISETKETPAEELKAKVEPEKTGDSKPAVVSIDNLKAEDLLKNVQLVFSCLNPECLAEQPVQTENGWIVPLKVTEELITIVSKKDGERLAKMLVKDRDCDPAIAKALGQNIEAMKITDEDIKLVNLLEISEFGTFEGFLAGNGLMERYASKIGKAKEPKRSFIAIPLEFSDEKVSLNFKKVTPLLKKKIDLAEEVVSAEKSIAPVVAERNEKISPEMQKGLDELFALEAETKLLSEQVKVEKDRVAKDVSAAEAEIKNSAADKSKAETDKKTAEAEVKGSQSEKAKAETDKKTAEAGVSTAKNNLTAKKERLGKLNGKVARARTNEINAMKKETGNRWLNKNTAVAQVQREIAALESAVKSAEGKVSVANEKIKVAEGKVTAANEKIKAAASRIVAADGRGAAATVKTADLNAGHKTLEARITANNARISELNSNSDINRAKVYAGDSDEKIEKIVDTAKELFDRLLES